MKRISKFKFLLPTLTLFSVELLMVWFILLISLFIFVLIARKLFVNLEEDFDDNVFSYVDMISTRSLDTLVNGISFFASKEFIIAAALIIFIYFAFYKRHRWYSIKIPVISIGCLTLNLVLRYFFNRPRPMIHHWIDSTGVNFPDNNAVVSFSFYGFLIYLAWNIIAHRSIRVFICASLLILALLIGASKVYLRLQYASDVLAGLILGIIWLFISILSLRKIEKISARKVHPNENLPLEE